jgi:hypothetical protein
MPRHGPTLEDFTAALGRELRLRGVPFSQAILRAFAADVWPLTGDEPDTGRWARHFVDTGHALRGPTLAFSASRAYPDRLAGRWRSG